MSKITGKKKKQKKWLKARHKIMRNIVNVILTPYAYFKYGMRVKRFKNKAKRQYLVLFNHQTAFDQFFVGMAFKGATYYVASEDLFNHGFASRFIEWAVKPIKIKKQATDIRAVLDCKKVASEGGTIALSPEGNRTFSGITRPFKKSITGLAKILKLPIAFFKIEGGYGVQPRWCDKLRKGRMTAGVSRILEYDDFKNLSDDKLYAVIERELYQNEAMVSGEFKGKNLAAFMERCIYICPKCGLSEFKSDGDKITCTHCGLSANYTKTKQFVSNDGDFPFEFVADWIDYQENFVNNLDMNSICGEIYSDNVKIYSVTPYKSKKLLEKKGKITVFGDKLTLGLCGKNCEMPFKEVSVITVLGKNKLNIYHNDKVYQIVGNKRFNAVKYVNLCYRYKNQNVIGEENSNGKFLGL